MKKLFTLLFVLFGLIATAQIGGSGNPYLNSLRVKELYINHATLGYHFPFNRGTNGTFWTWQGDSLRARTILQSDLPTTAVDSTTHFWKKTPANVITQRTSTDKVAVGINTVPTGGIANIYGYTKIGKSAATSITKALDVAGNANFEQVANPTNAQVSAIVLTETVGGGTIAAGTYRYDIAFITAEGETGCNNTTNIPTVTVSANARITLTNIPVSADPRVTGRRIMRTEPGGSLYFCYSIATINDNTTTTLVDNGYALNNLHSYRKTNTTGGVFYINGSKSMLISEFNTGIGYQALNNFTLGNSSVALGYMALRDMSTGLNNVGVGHAACVSVTTGSDNVGVGIASVGAISTGSGNTGIGSGAISASTLGSVLYNSALGVASLSTMAVNSQYNSAIGYYSGRYTSGNYNLFLGANSFTKTSNVNLSNCIGIGAFTGKYETAGSKLFVDAFDRSTEARGRSEAVIYGVMNATPANQILTLGGGGKVGINELAPQENLDLVGRMRLQQTTAPATTTDKLYNVGGSLYWNGVNLLSADTGKVSTSGDIMYGNLLTTGWFKAKSGIFAIGHNLGIANAAENKSVQFALSASQVENDTYTLPTAYPLTAGQSLVSATDGALSWSSKASTCDIQAFEASDTWTMPTGAKLVKVICIGGGGQGGSGAVSATGSLALGGAGGAGGNYSEKVFTAEALSSTVTFTVGVGGDSENWQTSSTSEGVNGANGTASIFGNYISASGGQGGRGGFLTNSSQASIPGPKFIQEQGGSGSGHSLTTGYEGTPTRQAGAGGASGGSITAANVAYDGAAGSQSMTYCEVPADGGEAGTTAGSLDGGNGSKHDITQWNGGASGGSGAATLTSNSGAGGFGGTWGGGGGGSGAARNGYISGKGGIGGNGLVIVITYF